MTVKDLILFLLIAICLIFQTWLSNDFNKERSERKAMDTLHTNKIIVLEAKIDLCTKEKRELIAEVREITRPLSRLFVVNGWVFGVREEKDAQ